MKLHYALNTLFLKIFITILFCCSLLSISTVTNAYYVGSSRSNIYHYTDCEWARKILNSNLIKFTTVSEALARGYRHCHVCYPPTSDIVRKLQLNSPPQNMHIGESAELNYTYDTGGDVNDKITITSSNPDVADIVDGLICAKSEGSTIITASASDSTSHSYSLNVVPVYADSVSITNKVNSVNLSQTVQLSVIVTPDNVTDKTVIWNSSDDSIITVDENGKIHAVSEGTCEITATCGEIKDSINIIVKRIDENIVVNNQKSKFNLNHYMLPTVFIIIISVILIIMYKGNRLHIIKKGKDKNDKTQ